MVFNMDKIKDVITFQAIIIVTKRDAYADGCSAFLEWVERNGCRIIYGNGNAPAIIEKEF